jgi:hypothetical protein
MQVATALFSAIAPIAWLGAWGSYLWRFFLAIAQDVLQVRGSTCLMMDDFWQAFSRLESAERALNAAEAAFSQDVYLFLVGRTGGPSDALVADVYATRAATIAALATLRAVLERCRRSIKLI